MKLIHAIAFCSTFCFAISTPVLAQLRGLDGAVGNERRYKITVPTGQAVLELKTYGGKGDADLYVKSGTEPTMTAYDFVGRARGNSELITVNNPTPGEWFIMIKACSAYTGLNIDVKYTAPIAMVATPSIVTSSSNATSSVKVSISCGTSGATCRYTVNGSIPTKISKIYAGSFTLTSSATVKSKAFKSGMAESPVASATVTIQTKADRVKFLKEKIAAIKLKIANNNRMIAVYERSANASSSLLSKTMYNNMEV